MPPFNQSVLLPSSEIKSEYLTSLDGTPNIPGLRPTKNRNQQSTCKRLHLEDHIGPVERLLVPSVQRESQRGTKE